MYLIVEETMSPGFVSMLHSIRPSSFGSSAVNFPSRVETRMTLLFLLSADDGVGHSLTSESKPRSSA